jgi:two-component system nitrate/nitrite response regulator NarL
VLECLSACLHDAYYSEFGKVETLISTIYRHLSRGCVLSGRILSRGNKHIHTVFCCKRKGKLVEHVFFKQGGVPRERWQKAFPGARSVADIASLNQLAANSQRMLWLDLAGISQQHDMSLVQEVVALGSPVIVMSYTPSDEQALTIMSAGVYGYCHAMAAPEQLQEIAATVAGGSIWVGAALMQRMLSLAARAKNKAAPAEKLLAELTPRELMVAQQVALGANNRQISITLEIAERTVKAHLSAIFDKLQVRDRVQLALLMNNVPIHQ